MGETLLGKKLKSLREEKNWTQLALQETASVTERTIRDAELGTTIPDVRTVKKLATALQANAHELLTLRQCDLDESRRQHGERKKRTHLPSEGGQPRVAEPVSWPQRLIIGEDLPTVLRLAAGMVLSALRIADRPSLMLMTGRTGLSLCSRLVLAADIQSGGPNSDRAVLANTHYFSDMETFGVAPDYRNSRCRRLLDTLINPLRARGVEISDTHLHFLRGTLSDDDAWSKYDSTLKAHPPSIHALSVAPTGELLGYEVNRHKNFDDFRFDHVKVLTLSKEITTYIDPPLPTEVAQASVVTMGMGNLLDEEHLLLILGHQSKALILSDLCCKRPNAARPFTALNFHRNVRILATRDIAQASGILAGHDVVSAKNADAFLTSESGSVR